MVEEETEGWKLQCPGIAFSNADNAPFDLHHDQDLMEAKIECKIGEGRAKTITSSEDCKKIYVELIDTEDLEKLLSSSIALTKRRPPLVMERIDLMDVKQFCLIIRGLEDWMNEELELVKDHFKAEANGEIVQSVVVEDETAVIKFARPKVALKFKSKGETEFFGTTLTLEVTEEVSGQIKENQVLSVKNLPLHKLPQERILSSLEKYIVRHTGKQVKACVIDGGIGHVSFEDPSVVSSIVANPPEASFFADVQLEYFTSISSEIEALCSPPTMKVASANSPVSSLVSQNNYSRNTSMEFASSIDPSASFNRTGFRQRNPPSTSSSGACFETEGHLITQDSLSSIVQEQSFVPGTSPGKPRASNEQMYIQDLECFPSPGDDGHKQPPSSGVSFNIGNQNMSHLASLPTHILANTPSQRIDQQEQFASQDQAFMSLPSPGNYINGGLQSPSSEMMETKVLVGNVPVAKRSELFMSSYLCGLTNIDFKVKQYKDQFLAEFHGPLDIQVLEQKAAKEFPMLKFTFTDIQDSKTLIVEDVSGTIQLGYLKLHFETTTGKGSVENVEKLPPNRALITFQTPSYMKKAINSAQCWEIEGVTLTMSKYYDFMSLDDEDGSNQPEECVEQKQVLDEVRLDLKTLEIRWLQVTLDELNNMLNPLKAKCSVNKTFSTDRPTVLITPQDGAEAVINWEAEVRKVMEEYLSCFIEVNFEFPKSIQSDIISRIQQRSDINLLWKLIDGGILLYGHKSTVSDLHSDLKYFMEEVQVESEEKEYPKRHVKVLSLNCQHKLDIDQVKYDLSHDAGKINVEGTLLGRNTFWKIVDHETNNLYEKKLSLSPELFDLFRTTKGIRKIEELMGMSIATVVYCLERDADNFCYIHFLCSSIGDGNRLKDIKTRFKVFLGDDLVPVDSTKIRFCRDVKWNKLVEMLEREYFVSIVVDQPSNLVKVAGEKIIVGNIRDTLENHLLEISSVEEQLVIDYFKWKIMFNDLKHKVDAIMQDFGKNIKMLTPNKVDDLQCKPVSITLQGDPNAVDDAKVRLELLEKEVFHLQEKIDDIPAAHRLITRMEDKINNLEHKYSACIDVKFIDEDTSQSKTSSTKSNHPAKVGGAILSSEVRVSLYSGNFTKHPNVQTVIVFVRSSPDDADASLKLIFESLNGAALQDEFHGKINKAVHLSYGNLLKMDTVDGLECNELYYAIIPCWEGGNKNEEYYLEQCLLAIHSHLNPSSTILLSSICSKPLLYPANVFAKKVVSCFSSLSYNLSDLTVAVYISSDSDAEEFYQHFNIPKTRCRSATLVSQPQIKESGKTINNPITSFISLIKGNLLDQQADVYICSTNANLELKNAAVSKVLLNACGEDLQKECSQLAPLNMGEVAVTGAKNLKCKSIFHVVLPDHSDQRSERIFRAAMQNILRTAKEKVATSIAIPSLGTGNLHFPAGISANIIYEEIMSFNGQNPGSSIKYFLVIFDQKDFKEFSKVHAQKMGSHFSRKVPGQGGEKGTQSTTLSIENLDISEEKSYVIVNTTTENMELSGSAVSKALLLKAGVSLQHACTQMVQDGFKLDQGHIVVTKSYGSLKCQKIIHAHVPPRSDAVKSSINHFSLIHDIVLKCLAKTEQLKMKSISFPAFGFGQGGYSIDEVAQPMLTAMQEFGSQPHQTVEIIRIVIFDQALHKQFCDFFMSFFKVSGSLPSRLLNSITSMVTGASQGKCVDLQASGTTGVLPKTKSASSRGMPIATIVFNVYASSERKCKEIADQLREFTRNNYKAEQIVKYVVKSLIDTDIEQIHKIEMDCQVSIKVVREIRQIMVQGEKSEVSEAKGRIIEMLNKIEKDVQFELQQHEWYTSGDGDSDKEEYSLEDSFMLERAYQSRVPAIELVIDNMEVVVDLKSNPMEERSKNTGMVRTVKREKKRPPIDLPPTWIKQHEVDGKPMEVHRVEVKEGTPEYQTALKRFHETIKVQVSIEKLERIQNPNLYNLHVTLKDVIARKYGKNTVEVKQLFHGLKEGAVNDVMTTGFNRSFAATANAAYYGVGVYFALNASYSAQDKYAVPNKDKVQFMFICSVIIGKYAKGEKGMMAPPPLEQGSSLLYDTLVETQNNPTIFVAVKDAQAYPEYLVSFIKK